MPVCSTSPADNVSRDPERRHARHRESRQASYQVEIQVTDDGAPNLSYTETLTIFVNDLNENPTDIAAGRRR